eukprot:UN03426
MYRQGLGLEVDNEQAMLYYEEGIGHKDPLAMNSAGFMYENGLGCEQDFEKAMKLYEKATEDGQNGNPTGCAYVNMGNLYLEGLGVEADLKKGI